MKRAFKLTCLISILLASITLVGHGILPHHHTHGIARFDLPQKDEDHSNNNHPSSHTDDHDKPADDINCLLTQSFLIPGNSFGSFLKDVNVSGLPFDLQSILFVAILSGSTDEIIQNYGSPPKCDLHYVAQVSRGLGSRGSPLV